MEYEIDSRASYCTHEWIYPLLGFMQKWFFFKHTKTILKNHFIERFENIKLLCIDLPHTTIFHLKLMRFYYSTLLFKFWFKNNIDSKRMFFSVIVPIYWMSFSHYHYFFSCNCRYLFFWILIFYIWFHFLLLRKSFK